MTDRWVVVRLLLCFILGQTVVVMFLLLSVLTKLLTGEL